MFYFRPRSKLLQGFRGGGKAIFPLFRDANCKKPNINDALTAVWSSELRLSLTPEDIFCYCYCLISNTHYVDRFYTELGSSSARIPVTKSAALFKEAVKIGKELVWLHTFGQRFTSGDRPQGIVPRISGIGWKEPTTEIPRSLKAIHYDSNTHELHVGNGTVTGVLPDVRNLTVSGMNILDKWLGARTRQGIGRAASKNAPLLDQVRPEEWEDEWNDELLDLIRVLTRTLELGDTQMTVLNQILEGEIFDAADLPKPTEAQRKVPKTIKQQPANSTSLFED